MVSFFNSCLCVFGNSPIPVRNRGGGGWENISLRSLRKHIEAAQDALFFIFSFFCVFMSFRKLYIVGAVISVSGFNHKNVYSSFSCLFQFTVNSQCINTRMCPACVYNTDRRTLVLLLSRCCCNSQMCSKKKYEEE